MYIRLMYPHVIITAGLTLYVHITCLMYRFFSKLSNILRLAARLEHPMSIHMWVVVPY